MSPKQTNLNNKLSAILIFAPEPKERLPGSKENTEDLLCAGKDGFVIGKDFLI
jgi:hypothetical protein